MKRLYSKLLIAAAAALMLLCTASCKKTCRCYHYNGNVYEFDVDQLNAEGLSCTDMEDYNFGLQYSLCERVF